MAFYHNATRRFFHCVADPWPARREVFELLASHEFRVDATILEKSKARPDIRETEVRFFHYAWFFHFKYIAKRVRRGDEKLLITAASINQNDQKAAFKQAIHDTAQQCMPAEAWRVAFLNSAEDPCLWVADYCAWALQRKWERGDDKAFKYIEDKVFSQFDLFRTGRTEYY